MEELLDLVDKNDEVIGTTTTSQANENPNLVHREVALIIYDEQNRVLFQKRNKNKRVNPGIWAESCAGHVTQGLTPEQAAHEELKEELGFDTELKFVGKTLAKMPRETHFTYWFIGRFPENAKIKLEPREVEQAKFMSQAELEKLVASGAKYGPIKYAGQPKDMVKEFWKGAFRLKP
jgi:isopentenyl-diphosphate delta-isomerase